MDGDGLRCHLMIGGFIQRHGWWIVPVIVIDVLLVRWWLSHRVEPLDPLAGMELESLEAIQIASPGLEYTFPTDQQNLLDTESIEVYQPTASGRAESALYGSVRTASTGGRILPSFHEGLDIAAMRRDRRGRPLDEVYAAADGRIAYINRIAGNSTYGIYVVLTHDDPVGEIFTLYAHLAKVESHWRAGQSINRGDVLGVMGNTASSGIPMVRAHLHFEIGMINNRRFDRWYRGQKLIPDHGNYHGHNLTGIDPSVVFRRHEESLHFNMREYLRGLPPAFTLLFRAGRPLDYFARYPALWADGPFEGEGIVMTVSEGGVPLSGRNARPEELEALGRHKTAVLRVDEEILGRNGLRLIVRRQNEWQLGRNGERWLEILTY